MIGSVGFVPLGPVLGRSVFEAGAQPPRCVRNRPRFVVQADLDAVQLEHEGYASALARLRRQCQNLGADGAINVRVSSERAGGRAEFLASGTAVYADGPERPGSPFTAHLDEAEFTALVSAGWVPAGVAVGAGIMRGHVGVVKRRFCEQHAPTQVLGRAHRTARGGLRAAALAYGPANVVIGDMTARIWETGCGRTEQTDLVARVIVMGTAIVQFRRTSRPPLTIMPLHRGGTR